ncbi:DUF6497 family protein [Falsihalocynthiibacter sp. SS001]|uniref:DUF6497 family protein n=1 Tax=Falsihalocynthiibacter sp. SS001 TaxID=3349698 RepID=UPI0036D36CBF
MRVACLIYVAMAGAAVAEPFAVPSGQDIKFKQVIWIDENDPPYATFRFVAPDVSKVGYDVSVEDILYLCENYALPQIIEKHDDTEVELVISLSQVDIEFGEMNPDVTQFFESFVIRDAQCAWGEL